MNEKPPTTAQIPRLLLPKAIYAVPGLEMNLYFSNVFLTNNPANYAFIVECPKGRCCLKRWSLVPNDGDVGKYPLKLTVWNDDDIVAQGECDVVVVPQNAGVGKHISMLIFGCSWVDAGMYPERLHELMRHQGNPHFSMIGSHSGMGRPVIPGGVALEGYGGWSYKSFATNFKRDPPAPYPSERFPHIPWNSPFVLLRNGNPELDFTEYFKRVNAGNTPDIIMMQLGANDLFSADEHTINDAIKEALKYMNVLLDDIRKAAPQALIGISRNPFGSDQDGFGANYGCSFSWWQYARNCRRMQIATEEAIAQRNDQRLSIIPFDINLDRENNFPKQANAANAHNQTIIQRSSNGMHATNAGYEQFGDTLYCWAKHLLGTQF